MNRTLGLGAGLSLLGLAGYVIGVRTAYPGRAFSVMALMVGATLLAIGRAGDSEGSA